MDYKIKIKGLFPTLNEYIRIERGNRIAASRVKKKFTELARLQVLRCKKIENKVNINFEWHTTKKADHDNICFAKKFILDGLVKGGVLENDNPKYIGNFTDTFVKDKEDYCIIRFEVAS